MGDERPDGGGNGGGGHERKGGEGESSSGEGERASGERVRREGDGGDGPKAMETAVMVKARAAAVGVRATRRRPAGQGRRR